MCSTLCEKEVYLLHFQYFIMSNLFLFPLCAAFVKIPKKLPGWMEKMKVFGYNTFNNIIIALSNFSSSFRIDFYFKE